MTPREIYRSQQLKLKYKQYKFLTEPIVTRNNQKLDEITPLERNFSSTIILRLFFKVQKHLYSVFLNFDWVQYSGKMFASIIFLFMVDYNFVAISF